MPILTTMVLFSIGAAANKVLLRGKKSKSVKSTKKTELLVTDVTEPGNAEPTPDSAEIVLARSLPLAVLGSVSAITAAVAAPVFIVPAVLISGYLTVPLFEDGIRKFRKHRHIVDLLDSAIVPLLILMHQVVAPSLLLLSTSASRRILARTYDRSRKNLSDVLNALPKRVWIFKDGVEIEIDYRMVEPEDIIVVNTGELIPVDGTIVRGEALIDQAMLTGESVPAEKTLDDHVFASTLVVSGRVFVCVEQAGDQTHASEVSALILKAADRRMAVQERGEMIAEKSLMPLLGLAAVTALFGTVSRALSVYLVTPGYTMRLLAPLSLLRTLRHSADEGILVKDGRSLELLRDVDTVVFDKTGTLTDGTLSVAAVIPDAGFDSQTVLGFAAAAESTQTHPIARAIVAAAHTEEIPVERLEETEYTVGRGICAQIGKHTVRVGSFSFLEDAGYKPTQSLRKQAEEMSQKGLILILVAIDQSIAGLIALDQVIRPEARQAVADMHHRGIKTVIISGDAYAATQYMALQLGIDSFHAGALPGDKASIIEGMQEEGSHVCFIGDGINDAAALKQANVSMSIRGASTIAVDTAQIVLVSSDLSLIDKLFGISENYEDVSRFTARLAIGLPLLALPAVLFGAGGTVLVIAAHNASTWVGLWRILHSNKKAAELLSAPPSRPLARSLVKK